MHSALRLLRGAALCASPRDARGVANALVPPGTQLVSVDLFETVLLRHEPGGALTRAAVAAQAARLAARRVGRGRALEGREAARRRRRIERALGDGLRAKGLDPEVHHGAVLCALLAELQGVEPRREDVDALCRLELELEILTTRPNPEVVSLLEAAHARGIRVVAVSDMYLSGAELAELLARHAVRAVSHVYSSCDVALSKFSGRLFEHLLRSEGVAREAVVHLGDNLFADAWSARAVGIRSVRYVGERSRHARQLLAPHAPRTDPRTDPAFTLGFEVLGPALTTAVRLMLLRADRDGLDELAFVARDGELLQQIAVRVQHTMPVLHRPVLRYVCLSRRSTALATLQRLTEDDVADVLAARATNRGLRTVFAAFDLDAAPLAPHLERHGLRDVGLPIAPQREPKLLALLADAQFQEAVAMQASRRRALVRRYLEQSGFFHPGRRIGLADVGWRGTIQSALARVFRSDRHYAVRCGLYLGLWSDGVTAEPTDLETKEGLLTDFRRGRTLFEGGAWYLAFLLEAVCRAAHGTTLGYRESPDGSVEPVLAAASPSRAAELESEAARFPIREGILAYAEASASGGRRVAVDESAARREAQRRLFRFAFFPTKGELAVTARLCHTESSAEDWSARLVAGDVSPWRQPRAWLAGLQSPWRAGYVMATGGIPLAAAFAVAESALLLLPDRARRALRMASLRAAGV